MPLRQNNTRLQHRRIMAGWLQTITLQKRGNDQREGDMENHTLFGCWREDITKSGEPIQRSMSVNHSTTWHIPVSELKRVGVNYLNVNDRFVNVEFGLQMYWNPESDQTIALDLFGNMYDVQCLRIDPPTAAD